MGRKLIQPINVKVPAPSCIQESAPVVNQGDDQRLCNPSGYQSIQTLYLKGPVPGVPSLWKTDLNQEESGRGAIIPLGELHQTLSSPEFQDFYPDENLLKKVAHNVRFYASWFPEQTREQFVLAHQTLAHGGRAPGIHLMAAEATYSPDRETFTPWIKREVKEWLEQARERMFLVYDDRIAAYALLATAWRLRLGKEEYQEVADLFTEVDQLVHQDDFRWPSMCISEKFSVEIVISQAAQERKVKALDEILKQDNDIKILAELDEQDYFLNHLKKREQEKIWDFFVESYPKLYELSAYWSNLGSFLTHNPEKIPDFFKREDLWLAYTPADNIDDSEQASPRALAYLYESLFSRNLVPERFKRQVYLLILKATKSDGESEVVPDATAEMEKLLVQRYLNKEETEYLAFENISKNIIKQYGKKHTAEQIEEWLKSFLTPDQAKKCKVTFALLPLLIDHDENAARTFLAQYQDRSLVDYSALADDPLWNNIWHLFTDGFILWNVFALGSESPQTLYDRALDSMPSLLLSYGMDEMVQDFYLSNHPYRALFSLPNELRPRGAGLSYYSIDFYPDPRREKHPFKKRARRVDVENVYWLNKNDWSHGFGVSNLAVGREIGLAPKARLYMAPATKVEALELPSAISASLHQAVESVERDPSIAVVGMSLGLEVPQEFRNVVVDSVIYQGIVRDINRLHEAGVRITISAGNSGQQDEINMLGFFPHVDLIGAYDSNRLTLTQEDDRPTDYTTGSDQTNQVRFYAHADPVFFLMGEDNYAWLRSGGTSSAQPYFAAADLLLLDVNPTLTISQRNLIFQTTLPELTGPIDPAKAVAIAAHLPGSRYKGKRLEELTQHLTGMSADEFRASELFQKVCQAYDLK